MKTTLNHFHCHNKTKKWIFHFISFILCLTLLLYRTFEWLKAYHLFNDHYHINGLIDHFQNSHLNEQNMNHEEHHQHHHDYHHHHQHHHHHYHKDSITTNDNTTLMEPNVIIILCNINPIRLSALFSLYNGSDIYTYLIKKYGKIDIINLLNDTYLTSEQMKLMAHPISSTLKSCQYDDDQCTINDFISIFTIHGWCYQFHLNISRTAELKLILDPQEYDYIIPNKGYVGFYLTVQNKNCSPRQPSNINNNNNQYDQSIIVGPKFHSYINVQQQYLIRSGNYLGTKSKDICPAYNIQSVVQLEKLPIQIHLLQKFNANLFKRNSTVVQYGILLQQKAFLQIYNHTAYQLIKDLSNELYKAKYLTQFTIESIWKIYKQLKQMKSIRTTTTTTTNTTYNDYNDHYYCYTKVYNLFTSISKDILLSHTLSMIDNDPNDPNDLNDPNDVITDQQKNQYLMINNSTLDQIELQLINNFFKTKIIISPNSSLLRKILTVVMKFRYLLSNYTDPSILYNKNITSFPYTENHQFRSKFTIMNCSQLFLYYEEQMNHIDHVNIELHNLMDNNHLIRLIFPKTIYPYHELSISSMVSLSIRLSKLNVPTVYESSTFPVDIYLKNLLLTIFISIFTLYLTLFTIIEFCSVKQTTTITNHQLCLKCQSTNQNQYHDHHRHHHHHDSCDLLPTQQYNQLTSFEILPPNNNNNNSNNSSNTNDCYYQRCTQNYSDSNRKNLTYSKYGNYDLDEAFSVTNNSNTLNSFITHKLDQHYTYDPRSLLNTSNVMYKCDNLCRTKAYLHDNIDENQNDDRRTTYVQSLSLPRIETLNDENISKTIRVTPKLVHTPYSTSSSKYNLHSPHIGWNVINQIQ
ncbi:unnamed protein product [Schistosoma rodhaini]|nr:unnamed protein product [Schistosoma rodhaini]